MSPLEHLCDSDPLLAAAIEQIGPLEDRSDPESHFHALCRIVVGQQLSVAVARAIWNRVVTHFGDEFTPAKVAEMSAEDGKSLGLSKMKTIYLQSLANHILDGKLQIEHLETLSDEEVRAEIVAVKGFGPWSADMFCMFHLGRPDILPVGDLGIREGFKRLYSLEERPNAEEMEKLAEPWRPHRTLASRYLWRVLDLGKKK